MKLDFHLQHRLFQFLGFQLALPHHNHLPAVVPQGLAILPVPFLVAPDLVHPEFAVGLRDFATRGIINFPFSVFHFPFDIVAMPETAVDEDGGAVFPHHDVGFAGHGFHAQAVAVAVVPQPLPHLDFGFGVAAADVRHAAVALCGGHGVGHGGSVLVEDDQCGDDAGHPAGASEDENDKHRPAPAVKHCQRREDNG